MPEGLRFACQAGCTNCCTQKGYVYLSEDDLVRIAAHLEIETAAFEIRYIYRTKRLMRFRVAGTGLCPFLQADGCAIHTVKPTQCRIFPFWPELVESRREWLKAAHYCPGIGVGPVTQIQEARRQAEEMREAYPGTY
jgi:uncharacterized protein